MTTSKGKQPAARAGNGSVAQQSAKKKVPFQGRYVAVDSHLTERNGSTDAIYGLAGERPAGRKLAQDIANACNQLNAEGYEVFSIFPLTAGRAVEATVEAAQSVYGRTYSEQVPVQEEPSGPVTGFLQQVSPTKYETKYYVDTGAGYSVTDGAVIIAKLIQ